MYRIVSGVELPFVPDHVRKTKTPKKCRSCGDLYNIGNRYPDCKNCRKKEWLRSQKEKGVDPTEYKHRLRLDISFLEREDLLESQEGRCAICGIPEEESPRVLVVDHCHKTGETRGLLCGQCNTGIGMMKDNIETVRNAVKYLEQHKAII